jgi:CheY-like chemotaxis protein
MDGYEATPRIRADPTLMHVPVIAVTFYALSGDKGPTIFIPTVGLQLAFSSCCTGWPAAIAAPTVACSN